MNNWDKRPELIVVYGEDIPHFALDEVATQHLQLSRDVLIQVNIGSTIIEDTLVYDVSDMHLPHIRDVLDCLDDHISETKPEDWLTHQDDYKMTADDTEGELYLSVAKGTYYGQNCKVTVYNITI